MGALLQGSAAAGLICLVIFAAPAVAQSDEQQLAYCDNLNQQFTWAVQIGGCTALIQSGRYVNQNLADITTNRGVAYTEQGDYIRAVADHTEAIRLNPQFAVAYFNRGLAYAHQQDYARAIADASSAIRLNPDDVEFYNFRADLYDQLGDHARAESDRAQGAAALIMRR